MLFENTRIKMNNKKYYLDIDFEPVFIKGYVPNGDDKMFVFSVKDGKKLYAGRIRGVKAVKPIRVGIATISVDEEYIPDFGEYVIVLDKAILRKNNFLSRKQVLSLINIENYKYSANDDIMVESNLNQGDIVEVISIAARVDSGAKYGYKNMKAGVEYSNDILMKGLKSSTKYLYKERKKNGGNPAKPPKPSKSTETDSSGLESCDDLEDLLKYAQEVAEMDEDEISEEDLAALDAVLGEALDNLEAEDNPTVIDAKVAKAETKKKAKEAVSVSDGSEYNKIRSNFIALIPSMYNDRPDELIKLMIEVFNSAKFEDFKKAVDTCGEAKTPDAVFLKLASSKKKTRYNQMMAAYLKSKGVPEETPGERARRQSREEMEEINARGGIFRMPTSVNPEGSYKDPTKDPNYKQKEKEKKKGNKNK